MRFFRSIYRYLSRHRTPYSHSPLYSQAETLSNSSLPIRTFESSNSWSNLNFARELTASAQESKPAPSENVSAIVDEISGLTLLEVADLTELLRKKLGIEEMPVMTIMMPGMGFGVKGAGKGAAGTGAKGEEKKAEKTAFDLKLEGGYEPGVKIKIIKEVRTFTGLGLKEAKDLVEKAPTLLKKGVSKEEAESIIRKMKDAGAKVTME